MHDAGAQSRGNRCCPEVAVGLQGRAVSRGARGHGLHRDESAARRYYIVVIDAVIVLRSRAVASDGGITRANQETSVGERGVEAWKCGSTIP